MQRFAISLFVTLTAVATLSHAARAEEIAAPAVAKPECPVCDAVRGIPVELDAWLDAAKAEPRRVFMLGGVNSTPVEVTYADLLDSLSSARVVFLGEQHDDTATHRLQLETLAALNCRCGNVALAMEQFERDTQPQLDSYLWDEIDEQSFLEASRPWGNYATDYRPLIEYAKANGLDVVAGNTPTDVVRKVSREGWDAAWAGYTSQEREWLARNSTHPKDAYWDNFKLAMGITPEVEAGRIEADNAHGMSMTVDMAWNFYLAQCLKDDTMAESVTDYLTCHPGGLVVHTNGRFHSDYKLGTAQRTIERLRECGDCDDCAVQVVAFVPLADLNTPDWTDLDSVGNFVVFVQVRPQINVVAQ